MAERSISAGHTMARGVTVARLTLDQLVLVRIQAGQLPRIATRNQVEPSVSDPSDE
jgi:hypothetical protein